MSPVTLKSAKLKSQFYFRNLIIFRTVVSILLLFWCAGFLFPLISFFTNDKLVEFILTKLYSIVCHQQSDKCISFDGIQLLVCGRCTGIYLGAFLTSIIVFTFKETFIKEKLVLAALFFLLTDVMLVTIGVYQYSKTIAFSLGLLFGLVVYLYLMSELENFFFAAEPEIIQ